MKERQKQATKSQHDKKHVCYVFDQLICNIDVQLRKSSLFQIQSTQIRDLFLFYLAQLITIVQIDNPFNILASHNLVKYVGDLPKLKGNPVVISLV